MNDGPRRVYNPNQYTRHLHSYPTQPSISETQPSKTSSHLLSATGSLILMQLNATGYGYGNNRADLSGVRCIGIGPHHPVSAPEDPVRFVRCGWGMWRVDSRLMPNAEYNLIVGRQS